MTIKAGDKMPSGTFTTPGPDGPPSPFDEVLTLEGGRLKKKELNDVAAARPLEAAQ